MYKYTYISVDDRYFVCDENELTIISELETVDSARNDTLPVVELKVNQHSKKVGKCLPSGEKKHFYICDKKYFHDRQIFYIDGMENIFCIDNIDFIMCNIQLYGNWSLYYIDVAFETTSFRFQLYQNFITSLQLTGNHAMRQFTMFSSRSCFQFLIANLQNGDIFTTTNNNLKKKRVRLVSNQDALYTQISTTKVINLQLPNYQLLQPIIGKDYWKCPVGESFNFGSAGKLFHFIKPFDSEIIFSWDILTSTLSVKYLMQTGNPFTEIDEKEQQLQLYKSKMEHHLYQDEYFIVEIENSSADYVQTGNKKKYTTTMVAWAVPRSIYIGVHSVKDSYAQSDLIGLEPSDILDEDLTSAEDILKRKKRFKLTGCFTKVLDPSSFSNDLSFYFYSQLQLSNYDSFKLCDEIYTYKCTNDLEEIFVDDLQIEKLDNVPQNGSSRSMIQIFCNDVYSTF